jgi:DNA methyltransferase 1-associated protein 1
MSQQGAATNSSDILDSLPPVVPSIGWRKGLDEGQQQPTQPVESSAAAVGVPSSPEKPLTNNIPSAIKLGNRTVFTSKLLRNKWAWKDFSSSARHDSAKFFHWVRANVEYADYPYARFDVHLDPLTYTDEEYQKYLAMSEVEDLGVYLPDFLTTGGIGSGDGNKETNKAGETSSLLFQQQLLESNKILPWTKAETDVLMDLCQSCDLRWPVIIDRWHLRFKKGTVSSLRNVEDLQYRYYQVGSILAQKRVVAEATKLSTAAATTTSAAPKMDVPPAKDKVTETADRASKSQPTPLAPMPKQSLDPAESAALESTLRLPSIAPTVSFPNTGTSNRGKAFDLVAERARRKQLEYIWTQSKEEAQEEAALRAELRAVEAQLRKLKKSGKHLVPSGSSMTAVSSTEKANTVPSSLPTAPSSRPTTTVASAAHSDPFLHAHQEVDASFNETAPVPTPGTPYLQSGRLFPPNIEGHSKLKKSTLKQMDEILAELGVPKEPIATKRSCDLFDGVRKDAMTLLILQKMALKKEAELAEKKAKLERRTAGAPTTTTEVKKEGDTPDGSNNSNNKKVGKESAQTGASVAGTEKASKKKRKKPASSAPAPTAAVAPVVSQPTSNAAAVPATSVSVAPQPAGTVTASSEPTATAPAPIAHATISAPSISQGKTTKAAGRKRARKK